MEAVVAHKVDAGEVQVPAALRALRRVEQPRVVRIRQFLDLLELRGGLEPIRRGQLLVLYARKRPGSGSEIVIVAGRQSSISHRPIARCPREKKEKDNAPCAPPRAPFVSA